MIRSSGIAAVGRPAIRQLLACLILALALVASVWPARADQNDPRLEKLFAELRNAATSETTRSIEAEIWDIWMHSGDGKVDALMAVGVAALNEGNYDRALDAFDQIVRVAPNFAEGWNKRATTLYSMGHFDEAVKDVERVLALEPRHFGALSGLGLCDEQLNKDQEALKAFERAASVDPNMPGLRLRIEALRKRLAKESI